MNVSIISEKSEHKYLGIVDNSRFKNRKDTPKITKKHNKKIKRGKRSRDTPLANKQSIAFSTLGGSPPPSFQKRHPSLSIFRKFTTQMNSFKTALSRKQNKQSSRLMFIENIKWPQAKQKPRRQSSPRARGSGRSLSDAVWFFNILIWSCRKSHLSFYLTVQKEKVDVCGVESTDSDEILIDLHHVYGV